jgi:MFS family permease
MGSEPMRSFRFLVGAQFFGAFNDNLFKQLILFLAASMLFPGQDKQGLAFAVFSLPFVLFSGIAGDLSERYSKRTIIVAMKVAEIGIMCAGAAALQLASWPFLLGVLFVMGMHSAFFGPSKYGVIPELVPRDRLLAANGTIAMTTFLAVLVGQALAGPLLDWFGDRLWLAGAVCVVFALIGTGLAARMAPLRALRPELPIHPNPFGSLFGTIRKLRGEGGLMRLVVLNSLFWFNGGVTQQAIVSLGEPRYLDVAEGEKRLLSVAMVILAMSIMAGSVVTPRLARLVPPRRLLVLGATAMVAGQLSLLCVGPVFQRANHGLLFTYAVMGVIGFSAALFVVPIQSYMQHGPAEGMRGQTFAVNNFMNFLFMFLGGVYYLVARLPAIDIGPTVAQAIAGASMLAYLALIRGTVARVAFD